MPVFPSRDIKMSFTWRCTDYGHLGLLLRACHRRKSHQDAEACESDVKKAYCRSGDHLRLLKSSEQSLWVLFVLPKQL